MRPGSKNLPKWSECTLREAVKNSENIADVVRYLDGTVSNGKYKTIRKYINLWVIDTSHFRQHKIQNKICRRDMTPMGEILVENYTGGIRNQIIKKRLIESGELVDVCVECGILSVYNGKPLVLQLDHINGNNRDNRIENLRILCPNCHSQTHTWDNKNR